MEKGQSKKASRNVLGRGLSALISSAPVSINIPGAQHSPVANNTSTGGSLRSGAADGGPLEYATRNAADQPKEIEVQLESQKRGQAALAEYVDIDKVVPNPTQPRQTFEESELKELAESIRALGVLQPVLLRPSAINPGSFEIIAGERRWRASKLAGIRKIPAIVREFGEREALEVALVENVQRSDLNPIEEALGYQRLVDEFSLTQQEVADRVGKDRASVANFLRLLKLPKDVLQCVRGGQLSVGHAKAILSIKEPSAQSSIAKKAINESLSVRALEALVSRVVVLDAGKVAANKDTSPGKTSKAASFPEIVDRLRNALGTKVVIKHHPSGRGRVEIEYFSEQELDRVVEKICC